MLVLGIDPGSRHTGFGVVRRSGSGQLEALDFGRFTVDAEAPLPVRLGLLVRDLEELLAEFEPTAVAIESTFLGMNPRSLIVLAQARGAILGAVGRRGIEVVEYTPAEVKSAVAGHGRAEKGQVERMVRMLLSLAEESMHEDASDALAVAICCAQRLSFETLAGGSRP